MAYKDVVLADAPIGYWAMDSAAALNEVGGTNNTLVGTPTLVSSGKGIGTAWSVSQNVAINLTGNYQDFTSDNTFSVEAWFKRANTSSPSYPTIWRRDGNGRTALLRMRDSNASIGPSPGCLEVYLSNGTTSVNVYTPARYDDDQWHHVVLVVSATGTTGSKLYVDNVLTNTFNNPGTLSYLSAAGSSAVAAGGPDPANGEGWAGGLSDVALYGTALSAARITAHYTAGNATVSPNVSVLAPAAVVNITAPAPVAKAVDIWHQTFAATADDDFYTTNGGTVTSLQLVGDGQPQTGYFNFPDPRQTGAKIQSLTFRFSLTSTAGTPTITPGRIAASWAEGGPTAPSSGDLTTGVTKTVSGSVLTVTLTGAALNYWNTAGNPWYGITIRLNGASTAYGIATRENSNSALRPTMEYQLTADLGTPVNAVVAGPMALTVNSPAVNVKSAKTVRVTAPASTVSVSAVAPVVSVGRVASVSATPMNLSVDFRGGVARNPDHRAFVNPLEMWIYSPNAKQYVAVPSINQAPAMSITLSGTSGTSISLQTDRRVFVTTPASMTLKMVGIYQRAADRYLNYIPLTADMDDVWLSMEENGGTTAVDSLVGVENGTTIYRSNAVYYGNPTFGAEGPQLRKAVSFDGVDDLVQMPILGYPIYSDSDLTIEFSIRTTQLNGTISSGNGKWLTQTTGVTGGLANESGIKLVNGELILNMGSGLATYRTGKFIADGKWHHVVVSAPVWRGVFDFNVSQDRPQFVMIDGQIEWQRYAYTSALMPMVLLPDLLMASRAVNWNGNFNTPPVGKNHLKGDMRDFVLRMNYAVSPNTARKLYYEWSESMLVNPEPMVLDLTMKDPFKARGNVKKMVVLYGLPYKMFRQQRDAGYYRDGWGNYFSTFAGYSIPTNFGESAGPTGAVVDVFTAMFGRTYINSNMTPMVFLQPKPFTMEGYMCYPVAIATIPGSTGPLDSPGIVKDGLRDSFNGQLLDNKTGLNRFLDVTKDLNEDITDFDAITAVNYPAVQPIENNLTANEIGDFEQTNLGLNKDEWTQARDRLRDSILEASYRGVNLWITEPHMAEHLGFIKGWDKHETGARYEFYGPGNIDPTGFTNKRAEYLDSVKMLNGGGLIADIKVGEFNPTWQANAKRQIVNLEPDLTNLPGYEFGDKIHWRSVNAWTPHEDVYAYETLDRMNGLQVGDKLSMNMWEQADYTGNYPAFDYTSVGVPRKYIVSARPDGIVGKVISKEQDFFHVAFGEQRLNRFKDNVYTIAAERGSVVRGRPIAGRAFLEFMDTELQTYKIAVDRRRNTMNGEVVQPDRPVSTWDFDTRRYKQIVVTWILEKEIMRGNDVLHVKTEERYVDLEDPDLIYRPFISMNARGLKWLQKASTLNAGDTRVFTNAMQVNLSAGADVKIKRTLNNVINVSEPMVLHLELRQPRNYRGNDVREKTLPMRLGIEMRGIGKSVKADPMVLNITMPDARAAGSGDFIYVYMDAERNVTLYIKEE